MTAKLFSDAMNEIGAKYVEEALYYERPKKRSFFAELVFHQFNFITQSFPSLRFVTEQRLKLAFFRTQVVKLLFYLGFFKLAQRTQLHVQNSFGLIVGQLKFFHHNGLGLVFFPDNTDNFI